MRGTGTGEEAWKIEARISLLIRVGVSPMAPLTSPKSPKSTRNAPAVKASPRSRPVWSHSNLGLGAGSPRAELFDEFARHSWPRRPGFSRPLGWFCDYDRDGRGDQGLEISLNVWDLWCIVALVRRVLSLSIGHCAPLSVRRKPRLFRHLCAAGEQPPVSLPAADGPQYSRGV